MTLLRNQYYCRLIKPKPFALHRSKGKRTRDGVGLPIFSILGRVATRIAGQCFSSRWASCVYSLCRRSGVHRQMPMRFPIPT